MYLLNITGCSSGCNMNGGSSGILNTLPCEPGSGIWQPSWCRRRLAPRSQRSAPHYTRFCQSSLPESTCEAEVNLCRPISVCRVALPYCCIMGHTWLSTSMAMSTNMSCSSRMLFSSLMISVCRVSISFRACFVIWESILICGAGLLKSLLISKTMSLEECWLLIGADERKYRIWAVTEQILTILSLSIHLSTSKTIFHHFISTSRFFGSQWKPLSVKHTNSYKPFRFKDCKCMFFLCTLFFVLFAFKNLSSNSFCCLITFISAQSLLWILFSKISEERSSTVDLQLSCCQWNVIPWLFF